MACTNSHTDLTDNTGFFIVTEGTESTCKVRRGLVMAD